MMRLAVLLTALLLAGCAAPPPRVVYVQTACQEEIPPPAKQPLQALRGLQPVPTVDVVARAAIAEVEYRRAREVLLESALERCRK